jgi:adenylate kinase
MFGIPAISTGDIFRHHITHKTELGVRVQAIVDAGDYVPDELTNQLIAHRLAEADCDKGFLLDGYPRTLEQVRFLDELLKNDGKLEAVVRLTADEDELVRRLTHRAHEQGRADDTEEAIRHRQNVYSEQTAPIIDVYRERGLLVEVDGIGGVDEVAARIGEALAARGIGVAGDPAAV